jgi:hypothetical protein
MAINNDEPPSSPSSPFSWRVIRDPEDKRTSSKSSSSKSKSTSTKPKKSHGISPSQFHAKKLSPKKNNYTGNENDNDINDEGSSSTTTAAAADITPSQPPLPAWKKQAERNVLIQEHTTHANELEAKRKDFRRQTQLKTWPLQDMAMEHLDHLLGMNASNQFHGGDYLSSESSSSISSAESSRPRLTLSTKKRTTKSSFPNITASPTKSSQTNDKVNVNRNSDGKNEVEQQQQQNKNDTDTDTNDNIIKDDFDGISTTEQQQLQQQSPLWSLEPRIFATEKKNGKRKYLVGEFGRIADWYWRKTEPSSRHLYEVIREDSPCRLYFDLEFSREYNPSVPTKQLLRELEDELAIELQTYYEKSLTRLQSSQIINLDSTNDKKFSRHWIVHLYQLVEDEESPPSSSSSPLSSTSVQKQRREMLFRDAPTVGRFIKRMVGRLADELAVTGGDFAERRPALFKYLFVNTKDTAKQACFIDLGVYTRNRLFRCLGSSKFGKATTLQVVLHEKVEEQDHVEKEENDDKYNDDNADIPSTGNDDGTERHYYPLDFPSKKELSSSQSSSPLSINEFVLANNWEPHARALADSLVVPLTSSSTKPRDIDPVHILEVEGGSDGCGSTGTVADYTKTTTSTGNTGSQRKFAPSISMARQGSPLPSLDQFVVECLGTRGPMGIRGSIRAWSIEYGPRETPVSFTYQMQRNRYCELVGRSHKSNNIFWTIDLISWTCIQGCHDPDCFGRGSPIPISNNGKLSGRGGHLDSIKQEFESWQEEEFEKALMALNLDDIIATSKETSSSTSNNDNHKKNEENEGEFGDMGTLSDEALLQACLDNPELFP